MRQQSAFEIWMRTGRWPELELDPVEAKFNPWHDPDDGRFTFAGQGKFFGQGSAGGARSGAQRSASETSLEERTRVLQRRAQAEGAAAVERRRIIRERRELDAFRKHVKKEEGEEDEVYLDTNGFKTVGIGHKVTDDDDLEVGDRITEAQKAAFFRADARDALRAARTQMREAGITEESFLVPLASVNFQLGSGWREKFKNTWAFIKARQYAAAAREVEDSKWYREDSPDRVEAFQEALERLEAAELSRRRPQGSQ